jgi:hypothetical protein
MRRQLDRGAHGGGVHYPWMDAMRSDGVRLAVAETDFVWFGRPTRVKVTRIDYFSEYDRDCAQISDPVRRGDSCFGAGGRTSHSGRTGHNGGAVDEHPRDPAAIARARPHLAVR